MSDYKIRKIVRKEMAESRAVAIEFLSRVEFSERHPCPSNLSGLFDYAERLQERIARLREVAKEGVFKKPRSA